MQSCDHAVEGDYIDMDISSAAFLCYSKPSPPRSREFEFQMSFNNLPGREEATITSPADELFYKGKLLPLHLPPRLQMVQKILQSSADASGENPNATDVVATSTTVAKAGSCGVGSKTSWSTKLRLIRQSPLSLIKLKASKAYLKSLFSSKSGRADEFDAAPRAEETNAKTLMRSIERERMLEEECGHRRSFSGAFGRHPMARQHSPATSSCSSSSSSSSSSFSSVSSGRLHGSQVLNRSSSVNSEMESSIQGAIAYCKESQVSARKSASDVEFCSVSASRIVGACDFAGVDESM